ncbi:hypothetical protein D3C85_1727030 [compost metagenome]
MVKDCSVCIRLEICSNSPKSFCCARMFALIRAICSEIISGRLKSLPVSTVLISSSDKPSSFRDKICCSRTMSASV